MALKRKRSTPSFATGSPLSTTSSSTTTSSPLCYFYNQSKPVESLYQKPTWSFPTYESDEPESSHHLGSRTRKRHRDDRPDEHSVHVNTISKLFSAQRQHPHAEPVLSSQQQPPQAATHAPQPQKSTLHSFWTISSSPVAPPESSAMMVDADPSPAAVSSLRCEDCEHPILREDDMDLDDGSIAQEAECRGCRRKVCDGCAVLWDERLCLGCARMR